MKKILSGIGTFLAVLFIICILILLSPTIIGALVFFWLYDLYAKLWMRLRHDPKRKISIDALVDETWQQADSKEDFIKAFNNLCRSLAKISHTEGWVMKEELEIIEAPDETDGTKGYKLSQLLASKHSQVRLSLDFIVYSREGEKQLYAATEDDEDQCGTAFPPVLAEIIAPNRNEKRGFTISSSEDAWAVISLLRGDARFTDKDAQLWAYIPEHTVWLVKYKIDSSDCGLRQVFKNSVARKFWWDKLPA